MSDDRWITTTQILEALSGSDGSPAWEQFCEHFRPVVVGFAVRLGLSTTDAEDAAQNALMEFVKAFRAGKYARDRGRLSSWLFGIARNVILKSRGGQPLEHLIADKTTGTSFWNLLEDDPQLRKTWDAEWQQMVLQKVFTQAKREFGPKTFAAFEQYAWNGVPIERVCQQLDMSRDAVYTAKSKVLSRMSELQRQFE